jgi:prepilin-type processing-associated H-X9-DG protein
MAFVDRRSGASALTCSGHTSPCRAVGWQVSLNGSADMILGVEEENLSSSPPARARPGTTASLPATSAINATCSISGARTGGAHFLFADGSVRFLGYEAAPVMPALARRAGDEAVAIP